MREWRVAVGVEAERDGLWAGGMGGAELRRERRCGADGEAGARTPEARDADTSRASGVRAVRPSRSPS